jgi:hypothetical protein
LQGLFNAERMPSADGAVLDRLNKASVYFEEKFAAIFSPWLETIGVESDNKEIRKNIHDALKQLREECAVKRSGVRSCRNGFAPGEYLRALSTAAMAVGQPKPKPATVTYAQADVGHPELFEALRQWRKEKAAEQGVAHYQILHQKTLVQIAVHLPDTLAALKQIKGIGKRLAARFGDELIAWVADYRRRHGIETVALPAPAAGSPSQPSVEKPAVKEETRQATLDLFQSGLSLSQIADRRGLSYQTIEKHLAFFVARCELKIDRVVPDEKRPIIEKKIADLRTRSLKELKTALGEQYSYADIKMVLAHLEYLAGQ